MSQVNESKEPVKIEIEDENETKDENDDTIEIKLIDEKKDEPKPTQGLNAVKSIARKRICDLTEQEKAQLINDAKAGKENENYSVKLFKNGNARIILKKQSKAQELIKSNESNVEKLTAPTARFLTDNQLLFEHIINLETQYSKLSQKHKKLKKRYNDLEGYLYADDSDDEQKQKPIEKQPIQEVQQQERQPPQQLQQPQPYVQRRFVKSWRDLRPQ